MAKKKARNSPQKEQRATPRRRRAPEAAAAVEETGDAVAPEETETVSNAWYLRHEPIILAVIIFVAFLLRIAYLNEIQEDPDYSFPNMDAAYKDYWARSILAGGPITDSLQSDPQIDNMPYLRPPAYPFFLAFIYLVSGTSYTAVRLVQMVLGLISILLLHRLGRKVFGPAVGLTAAAMMAVYWVFIFFEGELNAPSVIVFLLLAMMNLLYHWPEGINRFRLVIPALCYGVLVLIRPETLLFSPVLAGWAWLALPSTNTLRQKLLTIGAFFGIVALTIAPVTIRNIVKSGEPVLICTIGGLNFYAGHNEDATGNFPDLDYEKLFGVSMTLSHHNIPELLDAYRKQEGDETLNYSDLQNFFFREGLRYMVTHPWQEVKLMVKKTLYYWGGSEISSNKVLALEKKESPVLRFLPGFAPVAALFFTGLVILLRSGSASFLTRLRNDRGFQMAALMIAFVFVSFATHLLFFVVARFRVPAIPFLILFGAYALCTIAALWNEPAQRGKLIGWCALAAGLLVFFSINFSGYQPEVDRWHFQRGTAHGVVGNIDRAVEELQLAVSEGTNVPAIPSELGFAYAFRGDYESALRWYREALALDPNHADTLNKMGYALNQLGRYEEAIEVLDRAIAANYTDVGAYLNKGDALAALDRWEEAEETLTRAEEVTPGDADATFRLADLYANDQQYDKAIEMLRETIERDPDSARAHNYLGYELARRGDVEEAEAHYKKAVELEPNFALAHNNLGNLYAHQEDFDRAITHFMEVTRINPSDPFVFYSWGFVNAQRGEVDKAIEHFRFAVRNDPRHADAHNYLGFLLAQQGKLDEAIESYKSAVLARPGFVAAHVNLGDAYARKQLNDFALEHYETALRYEPGNTDAVNKAAALRRQLGR